MPYQPIENYGLIGNLRTAALVGMDGSIDWLCLPHFDSPSMFAAILDDRKGGRYRVAPRGDGARHKQFYWPNTNILVTRFLHPDGIGEVVDYMPVGGTGGNPADQLVRRVRAVHGAMNFHLECRPAFDYARARHDTTVSETGARFDGPGLSLGLAASVSLRRDGDGVVADFVLDEGRDATFVLRRLEPGRDAGRCPEASEAEDWFRETVSYWQRWLSQCTYQGRWREVPHRSALALKRMSFEPTGAFVAAPTTSLPEVVGGARNWDYRFRPPVQQVWKYGSPLGYDSWRDLRRLVDWVSNNWERGDEGSWEIRGGRRRFVFSRLMCWVALDRGLRLADKRSFPADCGRWCCSRRC